ncbi:MAG: NUDIX hydrolase [Patescibacteria group bacterium]
MNKTISSQIIKDNGYWKYKHDKYVLPSGRECDYFYGETTGNSIIIPVLDDGNLLLVRQHRYLRSKPSVEFPGGAIDEGETPLEAAKRELLEETGFSSTNLIMIGTFEPNVGLFRDESHIFIANELTKSKEMSPDESESLEILSRRPDEFDEMAKHGEIWDGQMLAAWAIARDNLFK